MGSFQNTSEYSEGLWNEFKMLNITNWIPTFDDNTDKNVRREQISKYSFYSFLFSIICVLIIIPLHNHLSLRSDVFKVIHKVRRYIKMNWPHVHHLPLYHNRSIRLFSYWTLIIFVFTFYRDSVDLLQITKRLGRISAALLPTIMFLTLKPSPLPKILYLTLLPLHKWISRSIVLAALFHSIFYTIYFIKQDTLRTKLFKLANLYGVAAMGLFIIITISSLKMVRRSNYKCFYYLHYSLTWLVVILIHFHARPRVTGYTLLSVAILVYQRCYSIYHTTTITPTLTRVSPTLTMMEFPIVDISNKPILPSSHIRIILKSKNLWKRIFNHLIPLTHPFTLLNLPNETNAKLLIRNGNFPLLANSEYYIIGVYEPVINFISKQDKIGDYMVRSASVNSSLEPFQINTPQLRSSPLHFTIEARRVLIFVGGSAISFGLPLLSILNFNGVMVRLIWCVRDYKDLKLMGHLKMKYCQGLEVCISGQSPDPNDENIKIDYYDSEEIPSPSSSPSSSTTNLLKHTNNRSELHNDVDPNDEIDFTSTNLNSPLTGSSTNNNDVFRKPQILTSPQGYGEQGDDGNGNDRIKFPSFVKVSYGRPKLDDSYYNWCLQRECGSSENLSGATQNGSSSGDDDQCLENRLSDKDEEILSTVWVVAAGPMGLVKTARNWADDCGLRFHGEEYTL